MLVILFIAFVKFITSIPSILGHKAPYFSDCLCLSSLTKLSEDAHRISEVVLTY